MMSLKNATLVKVSGLTKANLHQPLHLSICREIYRYFTLITFVTLIIIIKALRAVQVVWPLQLASNLSRHDVLRRKAMVVLQNREFIWVDKNICMIIWQLPMSLRVTARLFQVTYRQLVHMTIRVTWKYTS